MLDTNLQARLSSLESPKRDAARREASRRFEIWAAVAALGLFCLVVGAAIGGPMVSGGASEARLEREALGKLVVLAAESLEADPVAIWTAMERRIGRKVDAFSAEDQLRAVSYLTDRIAVSEKADRSAPDPSRSLRDQRR